MDYIISKRKVQKKKGLVGIFGIFALLVENQSSRQRARWRQQQSTGLLRQDFESPTRKNTKTADPNGSAVFGASSGIATRCAPHALHQPKIHRCARIFGVSWVEPAAFFRQNKTAKKRTACRRLAFLVPRRGFEPRTPCLKGRCSTY